MSTELTLIIALIGVAVSILTIVNFTMNSGDRFKKNGTTQGEMANDIKYIKQTQTDIVVSQKEILNKLDTTNERVTRLEEQVKNHDSRIDKLEDK